jgi:hypothetical protein
MNVTVTFMNECGKPLSETERLNRPRLTGTLEVMGRDSWEHGRVITVARVTTHVGTTQGKMILMHDVAMPWLLEDSFALSGTEIVDGVAHRQVWTVEVNKLPARAASRRRKLGYQTPAPFGVEYLLSHFNIDDHLPQSAKTAPQLRLVRKLPKAE